MAKEQPRESQSVIAMSVRQFWWVVGIGCFTGALAWVASWLLNLWVFQPLLCHGAVAASCQVSRTYTDVAALIIAVGVGVLLLVRTQIFRPLLVGLAAALTLWGVLDLLGNMNWYWALLLGMVLFGLAFALYAWVARLRSFLLAVVVSVVLLIAVRAILTL